MLVADSASSLVFADWTLGDARRRRRVLLHLLGSGTTHQTGEDTSVRQQFISSSALLDTSDTDFRAINDRWPVFAFARDLGTIPAVGLPSSPVVFSVGHVRDPVIQYIVAGGGIQMRSSYFFSAYSTVAAAVRCVPAHLELVLNAEDPVFQISAFHDDYLISLATAIALDARVLLDATKISADYAAIVALSVRQVIGATELTVSKNSDGSYNTSDVMLFMKEISSDGNVQTV